MNKQPRHAIQPSTTLATQPTTRRGFLRGGVAGLGLVAGLLGAATLTGCGQKGPLFLPEDDSMKDGKKKKKQS